MSVRVRFAPSPTGFLHVGGARTALFNYLFAKKRKGRFIVRIEDTDQERHQEKSIYPLLASLEWLGLTPDEGFFIQEGELKPKGDLGPYRQKDRLFIYKEKAGELISKGRAYYCFMSLEEEEEKKAQTLKEGRPWRAQSPYRELSLEEAQKKIQKGEKACIRFKTLKASEDYIIKDLVRGEARFPPDALGDFILIRRDGFPVYNFSCAVDDSLMKISHIFRGEEHFSNTLKQRLIQKALGFEPPQAGHLSIILGEDKKKLSKRSGAESLEHYKKEGFLPSALINFLALLGWNPKTEQEFFSKAELIQSFNTEGLNSSSAVFNTEKLLWLNSEHIKRLTDKELSKEIKAFLTNQSIEEKILEKLIPPLRSNFKDLKSSAQMIELFLDENFMLQESARKVLQWEKSKSLIEKWLAFLQSFSKEYLNMEDFKAFQKQIQGIKGKEFFMPLRSALMGKAEGVEIKLLIALLDKKQMIFRARKALSFYK